MRLVFITIFCLLQLFVNVANAQAARTTQPNMIFIMADDLGRNLLSIYGAKPVIKTPHLEQLAKEGVVFKNAYATPLCFPTRVKLVSGRYGLNSGAYGNEFPGGSSRLTKSGRTTGFYQYVYNNDHATPPLVDTQYTPSFALPLQQVGYATAVVGKWHLNDYIKQPRIFRTYGFDRWMMSHSHLEMGVYTDKGFVPTAQYLPEKMTDFVIDFIKENRESPFFVYYPMHLVHSPFPTTPLAPYTRDKKKRMISMIEYVDLIIGRLMKTLDELDLKERTIIFFSGDNGAATDYFPLYKLVRDEKDKDQPIDGKGSLREGGVNVGLVVSGGPVLPRGTSDALTDFTDILPTLADFAGVSVVRKNRDNDNDYRGIADRYVSVAGQYKGDGYSIAPFLSGQADDAPREYIMFPAGGRVVIRDKRFKLWATAIEGSPLKKRYGGDALYDLRDDPFEQNNLYDSEEPALQAAQQRLEQLLSGLPERTAISDHFDPVDWNYGMLAHWSMDHAESLTAGALTRAARLADSEGGYDAEGAMPTIVESGKLGAAIQASYLEVPDSSGLFYNFVEGDNTRFRAAVHYNTLIKIVKINQMLLEGANAIYESFAPPPEYRSRRGDREKFLSSMTAAAWVKSDPPEQDVDLLKQPYANGEGHLMRLALGKDATLSFELTTNDALRSLKSKALDQRLWRQWLHVAATWEGRDDCGRAILYINGRPAGEACLGRPLSAEGTDNLLLGGFSEGQGDTATLVDDIALWRQALLPVQIEALYQLGNRFSYNAAEVDSLFNTPEAAGEVAGVSIVRGRRWQRAALEDTAAANRLVIAELPHRVKVQFGDVMAIASER